MLIYHPSKDANHACYRIISLLLNVEHYTLNKNFIYLMNFYYLFPSQLKNIDKWPRKNSRDYVIINNIPSEYEVLDNPKRVFFESKDILNCAINFLVEKKIIEIDRFNIKLLIRNLSKNILEELNQDNFRKEEIFRIITKELSKQKLKGSSGIKMKTGLMEYKYD